MTFLTVNKAVQIQRISVFFLTGYYFGCGVAAVMLQDANAIVIAFGTEHTLNPECGARI
jgi:hypothetical protein